MTFNKNNETLEGWEMQKMLKKYGFSLTKEHIDQIYNFSGKKDWGDGLTFTEFKDTILNEDVNKYFFEIVEDIIHKEGNDGHKP